MPDNSFDVVSVVDMPEVLNAVQQARIGAAGPESKEGHRLRGDDAGQGKGDAFAVDQRIRADNDGGFEFQFTHRGLRMLRKSSVGEGKMLCVER